MAKKAKPPVPATPADPEKKAPVAPAKKTPAAPEKKAPVAPAKKTPAAPEKKAPVAPAKKTPVAPEKKAVTPEKKIAPALMSTDPEDWIGKTFNWDTDLPTQKHGVIVNAEDHPDAVEVRFYENGRWSEKTQFIDETDFHRITPIGW
jgi:hypothetical protein